jgi:hypothetical protein
MAREITVKIGAELSGLEKGLLQATQAIDQAAKGPMATAAARMDRFGSSLKSAGSAMTMGITAPVIGAGVALTAMAINAGNSADRLLDLSDITGLSTTELQEMQHVARVAGVNFEGLMGSTVALQRKLMGIEEDTGGASVAIRALGISVHDAEGALRPMNELFPEIINKLQGMDNVTQRNMLATQIFGRNLNDVAPVLGMTAAEMDAARQAAHSLGLVMGEDSLTGANDFRIAMESLQAQFGIVALEIGQAFIPILQDVLMPLIQEVLLPMFQKFVEKLAELGEWFVGLPAPIQNFILTLGAIVIAAGPVLMALGGIFKAAATLLKLVPILNLLKVTFLTTWAAALGPILPIIAAIGAVIAAGYLIVKNWDTVKYYGLQAFSLLKEGILRYVHIILGAYSNLLGWIPGIGDKIAAAHATVGKMIESEQEKRSDRAEARAIEAEEKKAAAQIKAAEDAAKGAAEAGKDVAPSVVKTTAEVMEERRAERATPKAEQLSATEQLAQDISQAERKAQAMGDAESALAEKIAAHRRALDRLISDGADDAQVKAVAQQLKALEAQQAAIKEAAGAERKRGQEAQRAAKTAGDAWGAYTAEQKASLEEQEKIAKAEAGSFLLFNQQFMAGVESAMASIRNGLGTPAHAVAGGVGTPSLSLPTAALSARNVEAAAADAGNAAPLIRIEPSKYFDAVVDERADRRTAVVVGGMMAAIRQGA